jgi:hypothetical protein
VNGDGGLRDVDDLDRVHAVAPGGAKKRTQSRQPLPGHTAEVGHLAFPREALEDTGLELPGDGRRPGGVEEMDEASGIAGQEFARSGDGQVLAAEGAGGRQRHPEQPDRGELEPREGA